MIAEVEQTTICKEAVEEQTKRKLIPSQMAGFLSSIPEEEAAGLRFMRHHVCTPLSLTMGSAIFFSFF